MSETPIVTATPDDARLLEAIVSTAGSVMLGLRPDRSIFLWNQAAEALYQTPRAEALGLNYVERFIAPEHREAVHADIGEVLAGKITRNFVDDSVLPDGSRRTLAWNVSRVLDAGGATYGILAVGQDITERTEAEERFRAVFEHVADGFVLSDERGVVLDCNPAALSILARTKAEVVGHRPAEFSPPMQPDGTPSDAKSRTLGQETLARGAHSFEWVHRRPDGSDVTVEVTVRHARLGGRRISVVQWHDVSARRELEREQAAVQERLLLAQKLEAVGQLAGGVAHDFNNLLTAVRNGIELAGSALPPSDEPQRDLVLALEAVDRASSLTRQLLAYSRRETARPTRVDLAELAADTLRLLRTSIPPDVNVHVDCAAPVWVRADRSQLEQVVMNLLLNARDAVEARGTLELRVRVDHSDGSAHLTMRDDGVGMDAETQRRIFEPFFTTKHFGGGTGLGLAVVYGVVTQWGGDIRVQSALGAGSTFEVRLPLDTAGSADDAQPPRDTAPLPARTVLLVEDEDIVRLSTARLLSRLGWTVVIAEDGERGWERYQQDAASIELVVTDVRMPRVDGIALARRIRAASPSCPILFVSGYDRVDSAETAHVPDTHFLAKPYTLNQLREAIRGAVRA